MTTSNISSASVEQTIIELTPNVINSIKQIEAESIRLQQLLQDKLITMLNGFAEGKGIKENQTWQLNKEKDSIIFVEKETQSQLDSKEGSSEK